MRAGLNQHSNLTRGLAMNRRLYLAGFVALATTLASCGDGLGGFLISNAQEVEMGAGVDVQLRAEYKIATPDDPTTVWLVQFITPLIEASRPFRPPEEFGGYKVAIIADDALVNAFAAPGGFTYISTGLILHSSTCAEIAGVMGHELGHVTERHSVKSIEDTYAVSAITSWFLGDGISSDIASSLYGFLSNTQFSQAHESESDIVGVQVAHDAGYNPFGLADFFRKLIELSGGASVPTFLSSHPANAARITAVTEEINKRYGDTVVDGQTPSYACLGTTMTLDQIKAHISAGNVATIPGTGEGLPPEPPPAAQNPDEGS